MIDKNILITMQKYLNHVCLFSAGNSWLITSRNWLKRCLSHTDLSCWPIRCGTSRSWCLRQVCSSTLVKCGLFCPEHRSFSMQPTWICKRRSRLATEHLSTSWKWLMQASITPLQYGIPLLGGHAVKPAQFNLPLLHVNLSLEACRPTFSKIMYI
jgi:hypothetical protein